MAEKQPLTNGASYGATTKPPTPTGAHSMDLLRTSSSKNPINTSSNVLLLYRMNELQHLGRVNFGLAVGTLLYLATNVVLFTFNAMDRNDNECGDPEGIRYARCGSPVSALCGNQPDYGQHRVDGAGCLKFDFHTGRPCSSTSMSSGRGSYLRASRPLH